MICPGGGRNRLCVECWLYAMRRAVRAAYRSPMVKWSNYPNFREAEFACPCETCDTWGKAESELLDRLQATRWIARVPMWVTSGIRCPDHNRAVGGTDDSAHIQGRAADIAVGNSEIRWRIVRAALAAGFERIGIYKSHVHLDVAEDKAHGVIWVG